MVMRIGMSADLRPDGSVHAATFHHAVAYMVQLVGQRAGGPELLVVGDDANPHSARLAAAELVQRGVAIVIGHFASSAARAACAIYKRSGVLALLPAATDSSLVDDYENAYQLCPDNRKQVSLIATFLKNRGLRRVRILRDPRHAEDGLYSDLRTAIVNTGSTIAAELGGEHDATVFVGHYDAALDFLRSDFDAGCVVFTDDTLHSGLVAATGRHHERLYVCGFDDHRENSSTTEVRAWAERRQGNVSATYFLETAAACDLAVRWCEDGGHRELNGVAWRTCLGTVIFQNNRNTAAEFRMWCVTRHGMEKIDEERRT